MDGLVLSAHQQVRQQGHEMASSRICDVSDNGQGHCTRVSYSLFESDTVIQSKMKSRTWQQGRLGNDVKEKSAPEGMEARKKSRSTSSLPCDLSLSDIAFSMDFEDEILEFQGWTLSLDRQRSAHIPA
jgi:hypothetical protein